MGTSSTPVNHADNDQTTASSDVDTTEHELGISSTCDCIHHTDTNPSTATSPVDVHTTGLTIAAPIVVIVICVLGAIAVFWYIRRRKGEGTNIEGATEQKGHSQSLVIDTWGYDRNQ